MDNDGCESKFEDEDVIWSERAEQMRNFGGEYPTAGGAMGW
jgi:hypothetical protein